MVALLAASVLLLSLLVAGLCWIVYGLLRQNGRILTRLEALEPPAADAGESRRSGRVFADRSLANSRINRDGLPSGVPAPAFSLPTVDGRTVSLADYAGRRVLLVFSDPECGPCMDLLPRLDAAARVSDVPVLVISRGGVDANRRKLVEARSTLTVALQAHWEISRLYAKFSTPIAYLVDEQGRIAAEVAAGGAAILSLLSVSGPDSRLATLPGQVPGSRLTH
ncbi:MAG TPA: TlpA disulfide reductase family protein [Vicinamibacterales bacterium]